MGDISLPAFQPRRLVGRGVSQQTCYQSRNLEASYSPRLAGGELSIAASALRYWRSSRQRTAPLTAIRRRALVVAKLIDAAAPLRLPRAFAYHVPKRPSHPSEP